VKVDYARSRVPDENENRGGGEKEKEEKKKEKGEGQNIICTRHMKKKEKDFFPIYISLSLLFFYIISSEVSTRSWPRSHLKVSSLLCRAKSSSLTYFDMTM